MLLGIGKKFEAAETTPSWVDRVLTRRTAPKDSTCLSALPWTPCARKRLSQRRPWKIHQTSKGTREGACSPRTGAGSPPGGHQAHTGSSPGAGPTEIRTRLSNAGGPCMAVCSPERATEVHTQQQPLGHPALSDVSTSRHWQSEAEVW